MDHSCLTPARRLNEKLKPMNKHQLEISLPMTAAVRRRERKPCRPARAQWWFERMRRVVDAAPDQPATAMRPAHRVALPIVHRQNAA